MLMIMDSTILEEKPIISSTPSDPSYTSSPEPKHHRKMVSYDDVLQEVGEFGPYQKLIFFMMWTIGIPAAFNTMGVVLIAAVPQHWCQVPDLNMLNLTAPEVMNMSIPWIQEKGGTWKHSQCEMFVRDYSNLTEEGPPSPDAHEVATQACTEGWSYDDAYFTSTVVTKFDLVCDSKVLVPTIASVFMAGLMVGVIVFGIAADIFGRKPVFVLSLVCTTGCSILVAFSNSYTMFTVIRFFIGFFNIAMFTTGFVIALEFVGPSWRTFVGTVYEYGWAIGTMTLALIGYLSRDWRTIQLVTCVPMVFCCLIPFFIPESPRWLYTKNRHKEADAIVDKIARKNHVTVPDGVHVEKHVSGLQSYPWDLVRTPRMRLRTINVCYNWFVNSFVYYGLSLNTSNIGGDPYLNLFISGAVELPAYIISQIALGRLGCKRPLIFSLLMSSASLFCILAVPEEMSSVTISLAMLGKFFISASFAIIYIYTAELCPTVLRNTGVSTGSFFARVGGIVAPYIGALVLTRREIPYVVFGAAGLLAGVLALALPETFRASLPETLEEGEAFGSGTPPRPRKKSSCVEPIP